MEWQKNKELKLKAEKKKQKKEEKELLKSHQASYAYSKKQQPIDSSNEVNYADYSQFRADQAAKTYREHSL